MEELVDLVKFLRILRREALGTEEVSPLLISGKNQDCVHVTTRVRYIYLDKGLEAFPSDIRNGRLPVVVEKRLRLRNLGLLLV